MEFSNFRSSYREVHYNTKACRFVHWRCFEMSRGQFHEQALHVFDYGELCCQHGGELPLNTSKSTWNIVCLLQGNISYIAGGEIFSLKAGSIIVCAPYSSAHFTVKEGASVSLQKFCLRDTLCARILCEKMDFSREKQIARPKELEALYRILNNMKHCLEKSDSHTSQELSLQAYAFIIELSRQCFECSKTFKIKDIALQITNWPGDDYSIENLARKCGMTQRTFSRNFRKIIGCSPMRYVIDSRIGWARNLLRYSSCEISEISTLCRCKEVSHFAYKFKKHVGIAPSAYRNLENKDSSSFETIQKKLFSGGANLINGSGVKILSERRKQIIWLIRENPFITLKKLSSHLKINPSAIQKHVKYLQEQHCISREGSSRNGIWKIIFE